jgi:8-oxo-dGTP pyrophosphatase MutT (NUDIX family)
MADALILPLEKVQFTFSPWAWPFAHLRRSEIDAHFAARRLEKPDLWNGRALLLRTFAFEGAVLRGAFFETDYASLLSWRDWGFPDAGAFNCFAMGALRGSDGAYLLGVMGSHTANAGRIYFPAGTPEPEDIAGDQVDIDGNVVREVEEETGLTAADFEAEPGWTAVKIGVRIALIRRLQAREPAAELRRRVLLHLRREQKPELSDIYIAAGRSDFHALMPAFVTDFLAHEWPE